MPKFANKYWKVYNIVGIFERIYLTILPIATILALGSLIVDPSWKYLGELIIFGWLWEEVYKRNVLECEKAGLIEVE